MLQTTSSIPALASTAGIIGGEKLVGDMEHGSSGASEKERVYLQAPYTQVGKYLDPFILLYCRVERGVYIDFMAYFSF